MTTYRSSSVYEQPNIKFNKGPDGATEIQVRASAFLSPSCERKLWFQAKRTPPTNEVPPDSQIRLEMGRALEPVIAAQVERQGYPILPEDPNPTNRMVRAYTPGGILVTGIPDARMFCGDPTTGDYEGCDQIHVLEIKTRDNDAWQRIRADGNLIAQPGSVAQLAFYQSMASRDADAAIASLNKNTSKLDIEWFSPVTLEDVNAAAIQSLDDMIQSWIDGHEPPIALSPNSWQCTSCELRDACGNNPAPQPAPADHDMAGATSDELLDAMQQYHDALQRKNRPSADSTDIEERIETTKTRAGVIAQSYMLEAGLFKHSVEIEQTQYNIRINDSGKWAWNEPKLRYYLTPEQIQQCRQWQEGKVYPTITSRKIKQRKGDTAVTHS